MSTGKRLAFERIKTAVVAQSYFNTFDLYNDQFSQEMEGQINSIQEPALYIEFSEVLWQSRAQGVQHGDGMITFHMGRKWRNQDPGRIFEMEEKLAELFQNFNDDHLSLVRIDERQDTSMTHWGRWSVNYAATFKDEIAAPDLTLAEPSPGLSQDIDLVTKFD